MIIVVALGLLSASLLTIADLRETAALDISVRVVGGLLAADLLARVILAPYGTNGQGELIRRRARYLVTTGGLVDLAAGSVGMAALIISPGVDVTVLYLIFTAPKLARYSPIPALVATAIYRERRRLRSIAAMAVVFVIIAATLVYLVERNTNPAFVSVPGSLWFVMGTLTFVGYGDLVPYTLAGRAVAVAIMTGGIGFFALVIATISLALSDEIRRRNFIVLWTLIASWPPVARLSAMQIAQVAALLEPVSVRRGETIVSRGELGDAMYFILSGTVRVLISPPVTLSEGAFFGELALLGDQPRSASVVAQTATELMRLHQRRFQQFVARDPTISGRVLADAMRELNEAAPTSASA